MTLYPTYTVAGTRMDDPLGRWELVHGTRVLPSFPGRRLSSWIVPGQSGDVTAAHAPGSAMSFPIKLRVNAVTAGGVSVTGNTGDRLKAIEDNVRALHAGMLMAKQGFQGLIEVRHYSTEHSYVKASARIISASEPEWEPYSESALVTFIFEVPAGVWTAPSFDVTSTTITKARTSFRIEVPAGDAPCVETMVMFNPGSTPLLSAPPARLAVAAGPHGGFRMGTADTSMTLPANKWTVVNALHWKYGHTSSQTDWGCPKPYGGLIEPNGRPMGSALTLLPEGAGGKAYLWVWGSRAGVQVRVRSRKAWY